jgi:PTH1 family peptidyl-tRNA hydrolase
MTFYDPVESFLIIGLGNPGREYRNNRHNVGFMVLDRLAGKLDVAFSRLESKALVTKTVYEGQRLILAKPQTFMNDSGKSVSSLARYYKVPLNHILIAFDDVDLPFETLRIRPGGGSGGQKGMKSIIESLGTDDFARLRVGIGRPPGQMDAAAYVLQDFPTSEAAFLTYILDRAVEAVLEFVLFGLEQAMNKYNLTGKTD